MFVEFHDVPFPKRTAPLPESVVAIGGVKRMTMNLIRFMGRHKILVGITILFGNLEEILKEYNDIAFQMPGFAWWCIKDSYYTAPVKEIGKGVEAFLEELGVSKSTRERTAEIVKMMFECDYAYLIRFQDVMGYASKKFLIRNFPKEYKYLASIEQKHEQGDGIGWKINAVGKVLSLAWKIPKIKKAIRKGIEAMDFKNCRLTEADVYHNLRYADYHVMGYTLEEKLALYEKYHGKDRSKWPRMISIR